MFGVALKTIKYYADCNHGLIEISHKKDYRFRQFSKGFYYFYIVKKQNFDNVYNINM